VPVGLLGFATNTMRVCGVIAARIAPAGRARNHGPELRCRSRRALRGERIHNGVLRIHGVIAGSRNAPAS
jgi:hypothetical protein